MDYILRDTAIETPGNLWRVNSTKSGLYSNAIKSIIGQVESMLSHHAKIHVIRFDLRMYEYTDTNDIVTVFNRRLYKWLKREYKLDRVAFAWCRELETAKRQHYHFALMVDGHKVNNTAKILHRVKKIWEDGLDGSVHIPDNSSYKVSRNNLQSIQNAIYRISYLAKARGKGYKPAQTKNYGTSRIKHA